MPTIPYKNKAGERISGVTTIIGSNLGWNKQQLIFWANQEGLAGRNCRDTVEKAADAGTVGHYLVECDIKDVKPDLTSFAPEAVDKGETAYLNFLEWRDTVQFKVYKTEVHLVSEIYNYGATPDCLAFIKGNLCLFDWKTGNGVYPDHKIQLAAYKQAWEENNPGELLNGFHLIRFDKDSAAFAHYYWNDLSDAWEVFKLLLEIHKYKKILK